MFRFIHAADLHLDAQFKHCRKTNAEADGILQRATFEAYDNLIQLCIDEQADALLIAGDVYDSDVRGVHGKFRFIKGLNKLNAAGIQIFLCHGNHDSLDTWNSQLAMPPNVHRFGSKAECVPINSESSTRPVVCGISYPTREVTDNLLGRFPDHDPSHFTIGLLHTNVGSNAKHKSYAPCTIAELTRTGYDYWALGHVHTKGIMQERDPRIVYPGNTQGLHSGERGERGVYVVEVDDEKNIKTRFVATDVVRWKKQDVDISTLDTLGGLLGRSVELVDQLLDSAEGRHVLYELQLIGSGPVHTELVTGENVNDLRDELNEHWATEQVLALCGDIDNHTSPEIDRAAIARSGGFTQEFVNFTDARKNSPDLDNTLQGVLEPLLGNVRVKRYLDDRLLQTKEESHQLIEDAEAIALALLVKNDT